MVKNLILVRHAEASEPAGGVKDIERELTAKGYRDAPRIGRYLFEQGIHPDMITSSIARRAQTTAELMAEQLKYELHKIDHNEELYNASVRTLLTHVNEADDSWNTLLVVGHNPAISYLAEYLSGEEVGSMAPAGFAHIQFSVQSWEVVSKDLGQLMAYHTPENIIF
jgi:phosphohistidine phosphatase